MPCARAICGQGTSPPLVVDGRDGVEGGEVALGFVGGAAVGERPREGRLRVADGRVHEERAVLVGHVDGGGVDVAAAAAAVAVGAVEPVQGREDGLQLLAAPDVVVVVPELGSPGERCSSRSS